MNNVSAEQMEEVDNQGSNGFSSTSFIPEFVHRQSVKKLSSGPSITVQQKIKNLNYQLFNSLSILTPIRMKPFQFRKQLGNYQFERIQRKIESEALLKFGKAQQQLYKEQQNLILVLMALMKEFRSSIKNNFYLINKKCNRILYFHHKLDKEDEYIQSNLLICNLGQKMSNDLDIEKISYQPIKTQTCQKLLLKNQSISIFYGNLLNKIIDNQKHYKSFTIIANFSFIGSSQVLPIQYFNGHQNKKQYSYIAKPTTNIIGENIEQVFRMKINGVWTVQNVKNVVQMLEEQYGEKGFDLEFQMQKISKFLGDYSQEE